LNKKWCEVFEKSQKSGMMQKTKFKARKTLKNAALIAKIDVNAAVNEPLNI